MGSFTSSVKIISGMLILVIGVSLKFNKLLIGSMHFRRRLKNLKLIKIKYHCTSISHHPMNSIHHLPRISWMKSIKLIPYKPVRFRSLLLIFWTMCLMIPPSTLKLKGKVQNPWKHLQSHFKNSTSGLIPTSKKIQDKNHFPNLKLAGQNQCIKMCKRVQKKLILTSKNFIQRKNNLLTRKNQFHCRYSPSKKLKNKNLKPKKINLNKKSKKV